MGPKYPKLFSPYSIRNCTLRNRIIGAPLGVWFFSQDNYVFDYALKYFEEQAKGGAASICVGHTEVNYGMPDSDGFGLYFDMHSNKGTAALTEFASAITQHNCLASIELNYGGVYTHGHRGECYGPDGFVGFDGKVVHEMTVEKIREVIEMYVTATRKMRTSGFNMITLHGAHGWLPMQFYLASTNHRTDEYGGSRENRCRFCVELARAVREAAGDDMVIEYRISGVDPNTDPEGFEDLVYLCNQLEAYIDIIHVSSGGEDRSNNDGTLKPNHMFPTYLDDQGVNLGNAGALKKRINLPVAVVGNIYEPAFAEKVLEDGIADFIAMGRPLVADPELPNKARRGQECDIRACIGCYKCLDLMHRTHVIGCSVNPRAGQEAHVPVPSPAPVKRRVAVVGGGPAGLVSAVTAWQRGHDVTLYEKTDALGGLLKITDGNQIKRRLANYKAYLLNQIAKTDVKILLNTEATPERLEAENYDAILVASGSRFLIPDLPGVDGKNVFTTEEAHAHPELLGDRIAIVGGNLDGCESALHFKQIGKSEVTILSRNPVLHKEADRNVTISLDYFLHTLDVKSVVGAPATRITPEGVWYTDAEGEHFLACDSVVLAVGRVSNQETYEALRLCAPDVVPIGDCIKVGQVRPAVMTGFYRALDI